MAFSFAPNALLTAEQVSKFLFGVDDPTTTPPQGSMAPISTQQQFNIELVVNALSDQITRYVGYELKEGTFTEVWDAAGSDELVTRQQPITSVSSLKISGNGDFSGGATYDTQSYVWDRYSIRLRNSNFPIGRGMIQVIYTAGYSTLPNDIVMAALLQLQYLYRKIGKGDGMVGLSSIAKSVAGGANESQSKDSNVSAEGLIGEVVGMLKSYRRMEIPNSVMYARVS